MASAESTNSPPRPAGSPPLSDNARQAINRRAQQVSLRAYKSAKKHTGKWVDARRDRGDTDDRLMDFLYGLSCPQSDPQIVGSDRL